tara:strand:- start:204 stop:419 length:216 start_codon:yes stop_codon:yes gene_type:complete
LVVVALGTGAVVFLQEPVVLVVVNLSQLMADQVKVLQEKVLLVVQQVVVELAQVVVELVLPVLGLQAQLLV